ncbi:hypothetical protein LSH36_1585g00010 [Paralvinella palmiformis]|uniref:Uncharacterized protein n=1 Tax=Paralvinella palmiformis TaxID=53620 RepID=A0AAD9IT34_9ANNE|nr:hypothetical protein LSH36_1585g00010 [Paralvinella palmiformis]
MKKQVVHYVGKAMGHSGEEFEFLRLIPPIAGSFSLQTLLDKPSVPVQPTRPSAVVQTPVRRSQPQGNTPMVAQSPTTQDTPSRVPKLVIKLDL